MSQWGTIDARFAATTYITAESALEDCPTGSESGPVATKLDDEIWIHGRLRDVSDIEDSALVLGWFLKWCQWTDEATLEWELDRGPRYRWEWRNGELTKLRGVLDQ